MTGGEIQLRDQDGNFNSHAHVERDARNKKGDNYAKHFNSHAHVERDTLGKIDTAMIGISTHTLTWSVTSADSFVSDMCKDFNSHAHVERDTAFRCL